MAKDGRKTLSAVRDEVHDITNQTLQSGSIGVLLVCLIYFFAWKKTFAQATIGKGTAVRLMNTSPELAAVIMFWPMMIYVTLACTVILCVVLAWDFIFLNDLSGLIGWFDSPGALATLIQQAARYEIIMLLLYVMAITWLATYYYTFMLHARRAHRIEYHEMIKRIFHMNLALVVGSLLAFLHV